MKKRTITLLLILSFLVAAIPSLPSTHAGETQQPTVALSPSSYTATQINQVFNLTISISNVQGLWGWSAIVDWNKEYLNLTQLTEGSFLYSQVGGKGSTVFMDLGSLRNAKGYDQINDANEVSDATASGSGILATLEFTVIERFSQTAVNANFTLTGASTSVQVVNGVSKSTPPQIIPVSNSSETTITLHANLPPVADAGPNQTVLAGTPVLFNATNSITNGNNPTYAWTFLDVTQQNLTGELATYTFNTPGSYDVTLTVQDSIGSDTSTMTVTVLNSTYTPPTITLSGVSPGKAITIGQPITFTIDASTLRNVPVQYYVWSMGNGSPSQKTQNGTLTYQYLEDGTYNVNVTILYTDGFKEFTTITVVVGSTSSTPTPSGGSATNSNSSTSLDSGDTGTASDTGTDVNSSIPPIILGILVVVTLFILIGSFFWLRNKRGPPL